MVERGHSFVSVHTFIAFSFLSDQRKMVHGLSITAPRTELDELERERREMTDKEREQSIADVYGTRKPVQETPELVADMLRDMQEALDKVEGDRQSHEYQTARWRLPDLVNSDDFHLMFLRSEFFDAKEAAKKMVKYWKTKVKLFGEEIAYRPKVRLDDLSDEDLATLKNDGLVLLPDKDGANRTILVSTRQNYVYDEKENIARLYWYLFEVASEDVSTQQNGLACILFDDGEYSIRHHYDRKLDRLIMRTIHSFPIRIVGVHHCFDDKRMRIIIPFVLFMLGNRIKARYRYYDGRDDTRESGLHSCGIPMGILPVRMGGDLEFSPVSWIEDRRGLEA